MAEPIPLRILMQVGANAPIEVGAINLNALALGFNANAARPDIAAALREIADVIESGDLDGDDESDTGPFDKGGLLPFGQRPVRNTTGEPIPVLTADQLERDHPDGR